MYIWKYVSMNLSHVNKPPEPPPDRPILSPNLSHARFVSGTFIHILVMGVSYNAGHSINSFL